jgi:hypothetical protein
MIKFKEIIHKETGLTIKYEDWLNSYEQNGEIAFYGDKFELYPSDEEDEEFKYIPPSKFIIQTKDIIFSNEFEIIYDSKLESQTELIKLDNYKLRDCITLRMYDEMKHCIGYEGKVKRGIYKYWRNYFCLNELDEKWDKLVQYGLANKSNRENMIFYCLSEKGIDFIASVENIKIRKEN